MHTLHCDYSSSNPEEVKEINSDGETMDKNHDHSEQLEPTIIHFNGAYTSIQDCIDLILEKITEVIAEIADATIEQAPENFFIITWADGEDHKALGEVNNSLITYSLTIGSYVLIEQCKVHHISSKWILLHLQLRGKENISTLRSVLQYRIQDLDIVENQVALLVGVKIYDLGDRMLLYCFTGHSHWERALNPFILCGCQRGQS